MKKGIIVFTLSFLLAGTSSLVRADTNYSVNRIYGINRYETSVSVAGNFSSQKLQSIIIASGDDFPDALTGSILSKKVNAPILLVGKNADSITYCTNFIKNKLDLNGTIYILGGKFSVSGNFEKQLNSIGYKNIKRLGGSNRFDTNGTIINSLNLEKKTPVFIVNGFGFPDALSISSVSASKGYPIIMSNSSKLPEEAKKLLNNIQPDKVFVIGGTGSINSNVINDLKKIVPTLKDSSVTRIGGENRYETSLNICRYFKLSSDSAFIASGTNFPDALSGSALAAKMSAPIILTDGYDIAKQKQYLDQTDYKKLTLLGGTGSISSDVENILEDKQIISDADAKSLLVNGDNAFKKILTINVDGNSYIDISGISYAPLKENLNNYNSINDYLNKNYNLNKYYTDSYVNGLVNFVFQKSNDKIYMRYGNPESVVSVDNSQIVSKKYDENKAYITIKENKSYLNAVLIYDGNRWLIDSFNNWGIK